MNLLMKESDHKKALDFLQTAFGTQPPVSFSYGAETSKELFLRCTRTEERSTDEDGSEKAVVRYSDPVTGLEVSFDCTVRKDAPVVEWLMHLTNTGTENTPVLSDIRSLSYDFSYPDPMKLRLHYATGSQSGISDFSMNTEFPAFRTNLHLQADTGKPTRNCLSYMNLDMGDAGVFLAIGWTGNWQFDLKTSPKSTRMSAGFLKTHLTLYPGESIRTPLIALLFWEGDDMLPYNLFRRYLMTYRTPKPNGKPAEMPLCMSSWGGMKTHNHLASIAFTAKMQMPYDCYWIDAGWYGDDHETDEYQNLNDEDWYGWVGNWRVNRTAHPQGLRPISEACHKAGMRFLLWFEPERAVLGTPMEKAHPEWYLYLPADAPKINVGRYTGLENAVLNMGNPEARAFITKMVGDLIEENGVDIYRQDANCPLGEYFAQGDTDPNRIGMTEIRYVEGEYAFLDGLLARFPHLLIDSCAGGGARLDLEMCGRGAPMWRSDYPCFPLIREDCGAQAQTGGMNYWLPYSGYGISDYGGDTYSLRSWFAGGCTFSFIHFDENGQPNFPGDDYPWQWHRKMLEDMKRMRPYFAADYYPLTAVTWDKKDWFAQQLNRPEDASGMVECFRREESPFESVTFPLHGLDESKTYTFENADSGETLTFSGRELTEKGFYVCLPQKRSCCLWFYREA